MAIQVTGLFKNPATGVIFENPKLILVLHLQPFGQIVADVNILDAETEQPLGAMPYVVEREALNYDEAILDAHDMLLMAVQNDLLDYLPNSNMINQNANFSKL